MKKNLLLCVIATASLSTHTFAKTATSVNFSPYADLTINTTWDSNYQDMEPMDLVKISQLSGIKQYHLAFITDAGSCSPAWGAQSSFAVSDAWGKHLTDKMLAAGVNFSISFGGETGADISAACSADQLTAAYEQVISTYQPQGLDFDIENGTANVPKVMQALSKIQTSHPKLKISFTLPVLPEGLTTEGENIVKQAQAASLNFSVNIMAMDYGANYPNDMGQYAIQAATNLYNFITKLYPQKSDVDKWKMIEVTPMIGVNDVNSEAFTLADADMLRDFAKQNQLSGLAMWSIARDNPCADEWASPICSGKNLQTNSYEFSQHFLG